LADWPSFGRAEVKPDRPRALGQVHNDAWNDTSDGAFAMMATQDAGHLARFGHNLYIVPGPPTRAEKLADAILPLDDTALALSRRHLDKR